MRASGSEANAMAKALLSCRVVNAMWVSGRWIGDMVKAHSGEPMVQSMSACLSMIRNTATVSSSSRMVLLTSKSGKMVSKGVASVLLTRHSRTHKMLNWALVIDKSCSKARLTVLIWSR